VAQNAIKHGLLARQNVMRGEDPQEFEHLRNRMLAELVPAGTTESMLAERMVSLSWRLKRAERLQNEVFDYLLAKEIEDCLDDYDEEMSPEEVEEVQNDVERDPSLAVGRATVRDYSHNKVLDRLMMYEQRIEGSLYRTMGELRRVHLAPMRQADKGGSGDQAPAHREPTADSAKQTQFSAADGGQSPPCKKDDVSCETNPIAAGRNVEPSAGGEKMTECAKQSQFAEPVQSQGTPVGEADRPSCETNPISRTGQKRVTGHDDSRVMSPRPQCL
jgi:hypothetical protein